MWKLIAACLALGGVSLLLPSEPSYDPLAWLIWGRELAQFHLDTSGGPSWKPLPVVFTTITAPFGEVDHGLPPALWMAVAHAGALLALALAFRLAHRLAGGGVAGILGGLVAVVALFLTPDWFQFAAHGSEAPLAVAFMLWAIERHLDGRVAHAVVLSTLACLLRPELVPFLGLYGLWVWRAEPRLRKVVAGAFVVLPVLWIAPEWIGSGIPLDGAAQARSQPAWSLSLAHRPWLRALERVHNHAGLPLELLAALAVAAAVLRRQTAVLVLAAAALAEVAMFVAMTQAGFSGNPRYVLPAVAIGSVLAGLGASRLVQASPLARVRVAGAGFALAILAIGAHGFVDSRVHRLDYEAHQVKERMQIHADVARAVHAAGGANALKAIGWATANRALQTRLAWELGVPMELTESLTDYRVVFRSSREPLVGRVYMTGRARYRQTLARVGTIRVYRRDDITFPIVDREWKSLFRPFTGLLQGLHTRASNGRITAARVVTR